MKIHKILASASLALALSPSLPAKGSKTNTSRKVPANQLNAAPFRFNGVILTDDARGSGFAAWDRKTVFSAAHVVFGETDWVDAPLWFPKLNQQAVQEKNGIRTRGYFRWNNYAELATATDARVPSDFSRDVIIAYSMKNLSKGPVAKLNLNGVRDLRSGSQTMITGYPAVNAYRERLISGFFLHQTRPERISFEPFAGDALQARLITTGPGNSGGPVWTGSLNSGWKASGVLVGGLPSETVVYGFSSRMKNLLDAADRVVHAEKIGGLYAGGVDASSLVFTFKKKTKLPDAASKFTRFTTSVGAFDVTAKAKSVKLSLRITTKHRGDLQVILTSPEGYSALVHNEGGADGNNLIINRMDLSEAFSDALITGPWSVQVMDRLKGDIATFHSYQLELSAEGEGDSGGVTTTTTL